MLSIISELDAIWLIVYSIELG